MTLAEARARLDSIDSRLIALVGERIELALDIQAHKRDRGLPAIDSEREAEIFERIRATARFRHATERVYQVLIPAGIAIARHAIEPTVAATPEPQP